MPHMPTRSVFIACGHAVSNLRRRSNTTAPARPQSGYARHLPAIRPDYRPRMRFGQNPACTFEDLNYNVVVVADILGSFEQAVLLAIVRLDDGAYGRAILKDVGGRLERDVAAGGRAATPGGARSTRPPPLRPGGGETTPG